MATSIAIADNIARLRKSAGITQEDLAGRLGVSKAAVSKWEMGRSLPDVAMLPRIAAYFDVTIDELIGYEAQLSHEEISAALVRLRTAFAELPFDQALAACRELTRDYAACYPLLAQIATLYLNHLDKTPTPQDRDALLAETITLCGRVRAHSAVQADMRLATAIEAMCEITRGRFERALELLPTGPAPEIAETILLANAHMALGHPDRAEEALQVDLFQSLVLALNLLSNWAMLLIGQPDKLVQAHERTLAIMDAFDLDSVYVNALAVHLSFATAFTAAGLTDEALACLTRYERASRALTFPVQLHGDAFFDRIEGWFAVNTFGAEPLSDQNSMKKRLVDGVAANPVFAPLANNPQFVRIVTALKEAFA